MYPGSGILQDIFHLRKIVQIDIIYISIINREHLKLIKKQAESIKARMILKIYI